MTQWGYFAQVIVPQNNIGDWIVIGTQWICCQSNPSSMYTIHILNIFISIIFFLIRDGAPIGIWMVWSNINMHTETYYSVTIATTTETIINLG